jgi:hypothetical protein
MVVLLVHVFSMVMRQQGIGAKGIGDGVMLDTRMKPNTPISDAFEAIAKHHNITQFCPLPSK